MLASPLQSPVGVFTPKPLQSCPGGQVSSPHRLHLQGVCGAPEWGRKPGLGFFSLRADQLERGLLRGAAVASPREPLGRHMAGCPTSQGVTAGASQTDFFNQSGGVMFSGSVRTHTYFYQPHLFSGSQVAAGPGRPAWTLGSHGGCPAQSLELRADLSWRRPGPGGPEPGTASCRENSRPRDHVPGSCLLRPSPVTEDPAKATSLRMKMVTGLTYHTGPNFLFF